VRKLIAAGTEVTAEQLADPSVDLRKIGGRSVAAAELSDCSARGGVNNPSADIRRRDSARLVAENLAAEEAQDEHPAQPSMRLPTGTVTSC